jgi:pimeloyl-ACP methyl ester carboxylesterase
MGPPPYDGDWRKKTITQRGYLARFGGEVHQSRFGASGRVVNGLLFSREYTLTDRVNVVRGILGSMRLLWPELLQVDLFESTPEIKVPVFLIEGRHDYECPSEIAERYFNALRAPAKELIWFDRSAHLPNAEEPDLFNKIMVEKVLPIAARHSTQRLEPGVGGRHGRN